MAASALAALFILLDEEGDNEGEEENAAFFLGVILVLISSDDFPDLTLEELLSAIPVSFMSDGFIGARYVSRTVFRV